MHIDLLVTDLDRTLVGDHASLQALNLRLQRLQSEGLKLVYATGRSLSSYRELQATEQLLIPDALIAAVGTELYVGAALEHDPTWPVVADWDVINIQSALIALPGLTKQPMSEQSPHRLSYFLDDGEDKLDEITRLLADYKAETVYSSSQFLDILPRGIDKGSALQHLLQLWGIDAAAVIVCGDSGNDISMLTDHAAIVVGDARADVLKWMIKDPQPKVYLAQADYAAGIVEGLEHFGVL